MKTLASSTGTGARIAAFLILSTVAGVAATPSITQQIEPPEAAVGDQITVTITIQNGSSAGIKLPHVDGLQLEGSAAANNITVINGAVSSTESQIYTLEATQAGDFVIPAFDIRLGDGSTLRTKEMKVHVVDNSTAPQAQVPAPAPPVSTGPSVPANVPLPSFNPNGPVVMPPNPAPDASAPGNTPATTEPGVPTESDGRPARVFIIVTPQTTDAYVGQSIPLRISFYIRLDVAAQQDSLPTIKGSDFLMNNLSLRPQSEVRQIMNENFGCETWITAISAPKSGDHPLQMERDTYWVKSNASPSVDPFGNFFVSRPNLAHQMIPSNQSIIHVHSLPDEGRPASFSGAIGHFKVAGGAEPLSVAVGEPVILHFNVEGDGNFDYVRCPTLADDPAWKSYVPKSKIEYQDQARTQGVKYFEQEIVPQKGGSLPLPQATFSYFDPTTKQYNSVPISLPTVTVTGSALPAPAKPEGPTDPAVLAEALANAYMPNHLNAGTFHSSLNPLYRETWFWAVQGGALATFLLGLVYLVVRPRDRNDAILAEEERQRRAHSLHEQQDAMSDAVQRGDAPAFFTAARQAIQLQLATQWQMRPESITLAEIRERDPNLAEAVEPLFAQADEVNYSGHASGDLDLADWERRARELLQPQPA